MEAPAEFTSVNFARNQKLLLQVRVAGDPSRLLGGDAIESHFLINSDEIMKGFIVFLKPVEYRFSEKCEKSGKNTGLSICTARSQTIEIDN